MQNIKQRWSMQGLTLIEILVVVAIMGILLVLIVPNLIGRVDQARRTAAKSDIHTLSNVLEQYKLDTGIYPTTEQGLQALMVQPSNSPVPNNWGGPYLKTLPKDPWGNNYQYRQPGQHGDYDIFSYGPKGQAGGEEAIGNWTANK